MQECLELKEAPVRLKRRTSRKFWCLRIDLSGQFASNAKLQENSQEVEEMKHCRIQCQPSAPKLAEV